MATIEDIETTHGPDYWDGVTRSYIPPAELRLPASVRLHEAWREDIDPITYEVVRYALMNANIEHSALLTRLSVSPVVMLGRDCQSSILMENGDLIFLGPNLQYFSNAHSLAIKWTMERRAENPGIGEDDMFLSNDPFVGAPHQNDACVAAPVFVGGKIFCWVANSAHHADVGGPAPGSFCVGANDTWEEAANWPPVKLVSGGRLNEDILELFARQSRVPVQVRMDLRASIAATEVTKAKILSLVERYGAEVVKGVMRRTLDAGERLFAERLEAIPDGVWSHRAFTEGAVRGDRRLFAYQINVTKKGGKLIVDNVGTDPQIGAINVSFAAFAGAVLCAITQQMTSDLAGAYGGVYRRVEFRPVSGLMNCAEFPAAVSPSGVTTTEMQMHIASSAIDKMLASGGEEAEDLILGPCLPHAYAHLSNGVAADGEFFVCVNIDPNMGTLAGRPGRDGIDVGGQWWIPDSIVANVEEFEAQVPLLCLYRRLLPIGADGAGRHRAGLGFVEAYTPIGVRALHIDLNMGEPSSKGHGLFGGNPSTRSNFRIARGSDVLERLAEDGPPQSFGDFGGSEELPGFKGFPVDVLDGEAWETNSPTAPGYGDPLRRDPTAVAADVAGGMLSAETARRAYAVALADDGALDQPGTAELRLGRRRDRLGGAEPQEPVAPPAGSIGVGELLHVVEGRWWCNGADLGPVEDNYKDRAIRRDTLMRTMGEEFDYPDHEQADRVVLREYLCPVTGHRIDTEIARPEEEPHHDVRVTARSFEELRERRP
jgi:N-methylhydantoinase B